jgi:hypothetical protein
MFSSHPKDGVRVATFLLDTLSPCAAFAARLCHRLGGHVSADRKRLLLSQMWLNGLSGAKLEVTQKQESRRLSCATAAVVSYEARLQSINKVKSRLGFGLIDRRYVRGMNFSLMISRPCLHSSHVALQLASGTPTLIAAIAMHTRVFQLWTRPR